MSQDFELKKKKRPDVSIALWIPLLWMLRCGTRSIAYWINPDLMTIENTNYLEGSPIDRNFFIVLEIIGFAILIGRSFRWIEFIKRNKIIVILFAFMGISIIWSNFPLVSFKRWVRGIGDLIMVLVVATELNFSAAVNRLFRRFIYLTIPLSVIMVKYFRELGVMYDHTGRFEMWTGVATHKNSLGQLAVFSSIFLLWSLFRRGTKKHLLDIPVLLMSFWLLAGSRTATSKTSVMVFIIGLLLLGLLKMVKDNVAYLGYGVGFGVPLLVAGHFMTMIFYQDSLLETVVLKSGRDMTLTGRTELWSELIKIASKHAFLGAGFGSFWIGNLGHNLWNLFVWHPGQAHNGYVDVYVNIGIVGLVLVALLIISAYKDVIQRIGVGDSFAKFRLVIISLIVLYNITESSFTSPTSFLWFVFLLMALRLPVSENEQPVGQTSFAGSVG